MLQQHRASAPPVMGSVGIAHLSPHFEECCDGKYTRRWLLVSDVANCSHPVPKSLLWKRHQTSYSWSISDQPRPSYPSNVELQNWISAPLDTVMSCTSRRTRLLSTWTELGSRLQKPLIAAVIPLLKPVHYPLGQDAYLGTESHAIIPSSTGPRKQSVVSKPRGLPKWSIPHNTSAIADKPSQQFHINRWNINFFNGIMLCALQQALFGINILSPS